jgi:UDP-N-acetylmuramyl tripeptide synthase
VGIIKKLKNFWHLWEAVGACFYYNFPGKKLTVVGVTGTDGKTTTTNLVYHILTEAGFKTAVLSTLSSAHTTTPGSWKLQKFLAQSLKNGCTHIVLEVSSHAIDQHRIWGIPFAVGVLTNIANNEHLDYHKTFAKYTQTKLSFLRSCKKVVLPKEFFQHPMVNDQHPMNFSISQWKKLKLETNLVGDFNKMNILAAVWVARVLEVDEETIKKAVASFEPPSGRFEMITKKPFKVIVDFAHTPQAFEKVLPEAKKLGKRLIHVFGCTGDRDKGKRPVMGEIAAKFDDVIILTTEDTYNERSETILEQIRKGIKNYAMSAGRQELRIKRETTFEIPDRREAIRKALEIAKSGDVIIITGVGHQKSLNIGGREVPWSDQRVVGEEIKDKKQK